MPITASYETLMRQAPMTADEYLHAAVRSLDKQFGEGYAQAHPELVAGYMKVCASDFGASILVVAIQEVAEQLGNMGNNERLAEAVQAAASEIALALG